jgi:hypothetical protein
MEVAIFLFIINFYWSIHFQPTNEILFYKFNLSLNLKFQLFYYKQNSLQLELYFYMYMVNL